MNPPSGGDTIPRGRDDTVGSSADTEDMESLGHEIIGLLPSATLLLIAAALALVTLSGLAAEVLSRVEDLAYSWETRSSLRRSTGDRYGTAVRGELKNVR